MTTKTTALTGSDMFPKLVVQVRSQVRSAAYKAALGQYKKACLGFILGSRENLNRPFFDFALTAAVLKSTDGHDCSDETEQALVERLPAARELALACGCVIIGLWAAWETFLVPQRHARLGAMMDFAVKNDIPFVMQVETDGGETFWGPAIFFANCFPHTALHYEMLHRKSVLPADNPRRVHALWLKKLKQAGLENLA